MFNIIVLISFLNFSEKSPEQIAFNFFVTDIFPKNYAKNKKIYFSGKTEDEKTIYFDDFSGNS